LIESDSLARELVLVVASSVTLAGSVLDTDGHALPGASIAVPMAFGMRARFDAILDASSTVERRTIAGSDGSFELRDVPLVPGAKLVTEHAGYRSDTRELPPYDDAALAIVLHPARRAAERLVGTVIDPAGDPVEDAWVALDIFSTKSGPGGVFSLELTDPDDSPRPQTISASSHLRAVKPRYLPAELLLSREREWPDPLVLQLGGPPLGIRGRVLDVEGNPVPGAQVWTPEETHFGYIEIESGEMSMRAGASIEGILRGDPWERRTRTDSAGRFELAGLCPREYRVLALESVHLGAASETVLAGSLDVEIRLPDEERHARVAGRVTSFSGEPIPGLRVTLERDLEGLALGELDRLESLAATTGADGRFELADISRAANRVNVQGQELGLLAFERELGPDDDVENLAIAVPLRVHVQVDAASQSSLDELVVLDASGAELELSVQHGSSSYGMSRIRLQEGRSEPFSVLETARTIVFFAKGAEAFRLPLKLVPGELNVVTL
jgi:protocatechuate 3,4-dioxygenase beta subunit